jgi:hypothetical protein
MWERKMNGTGFGSHIAAGFFGCVVGYVLSTLKL